MCQHYRSRDDTEAQRLDRLRLGRYSFPDEQLNVINSSRTSPWYADYANYIVAKFIPPSFTYQQKKKFFYGLRHYFSDDPHLYKEGVDGIIRRCVPEHE